MRNRSSWAESARATRLADLESRPKTMVQQGDALEGLVINTLPFFGRPGTAHAKLERAKRGSHATTLLMNGRFQNLPAETQDRVLREMKAYEAKDDQIALTHLRALATDRFFAELPASYQAELLADLASAPQSREQAHKIRSLARHPNLHQRAARTLS